jgi:hypothetical protein
MAAKRASLAASGFASSAWPPRSWCIRRRLRVVAIGDRDVEVEVEVLPNEDAQGNVHAIRRLNACSFANGACDTAQSMTSWFAR